MIYQHQHFGVSEYFRKERGRDFNFPKHIHRSFEFITVLSGSMTVTVGDRSYVLEKNQGVLIFPDQIHALESTKSEHMLIIFSPDIVRAYYSRHQGDSPTNNKISVPSYIVSQMEMLEDGCSAIKMKAVLYSICSLLDESTEYVKRKRTDARLLYSIFDFVEQNFEGDCTLAQLCESLGYNATYVSRFFSEMTQMSFVEFVNRYKISKACYLLSNTEKSILECSYDCGYKSLRTFNRNFKMYVGMTPTEYRDNDKEAFVV